MVGDHLDNNHLVRTNTSSKVSIQIPVYLAGKKVILPLFQESSRKGITLRICPGWDWIRLTDPRKDWLNWPVGWCWICLVGWFSEPC